VIAAAGTCKRKNGFFARALELLRTRLHDRITRHQKRDLFQHHEPQRPAGHVDAFPEAHRGYKHRVARGAKGADQGRFGRRPLHEYAPPRQPFGQHGVQRVHRTQ